MSFVNGLGRKVLINTVCDVAAGFPSSLDFGVFLVSEFAGLLGAVKVDSSQNNVARLEFAYQATSGTTIISSSIPVSSGGCVVNELNAGAYVGVSLSQLNSATPVRLFLTGIPIR